MRRGKHSFLVIAALVALGALLAPAAGAATFTQYPLPGNNVFPEGVAYQPSTGDFFVGNTVDGTVYRGNVDGRPVTVFLPGGSDGRKDVRGLKVDNQGRLFLAGGASGLIFVYDIASMQLLGKFETGVTPTFVNDVTIAPSGDAFFTDSNSPVVYRVTRNAQGAFTFERWLNLAGTVVVYGQGFNFNGIAATADGRYLLAVQSNTGKLFRIEIATKTVSEVAISGGPLTGGDGLWLDGQTLYAARNSANLLLAIQLAGDFASGAIVATLTDPAFTFPTTLAKAGDRLLVVNSQLDKRTANAAPTLPFVILSVPLPAAAMPNLPNTGAGGAFAQRGAGNGQRGTEQVTAGLAVAMAMAMAVTGALALLGATLLGARRRGLRRGLRALPVRQR